MWRSATAAITPRSCSGLTGLDVGEGQARILLGDLQAYQGQLCCEAGHDVDDRTAAQLWVMEVATPTMHRAHVAVGGTGTPIQAYCDLLEVRWLLSEQAGRDVGMPLAAGFAVNDFLISGSGCEG